MLFYENFENTQYVKQRQTCKCEGMENGCQQRNARRSASACRFVFNQAPALQQQDDKDSGTCIRHEKMARHLIAWKKDSQILISMQHATSRRQGSPC